MIWAEMNLCGKQIIGNVVYFLELSYVLHCQNVDSDCLDDLIISSTGI